MSEDQQRQFDAGMDRLRGQLFEAIESFGLPEKQEKAAKGVIRSITYNQQRSIKEATSV